MSEVDARPAVPAKAGDFVALRCGVIVGPLNDDADESFPLEIANAVMCWRSDGAYRADGSRHDNDIVAIVPPPTSAKEQPVERSGGVTMRVGGRYRLRNGEVWTCDKKGNGRVYRVSSDRNSDGHCYSKWVDEYGSVYGGGALDDHDVIAEVTDDATSEPQQVEADDVNHPKHYTSHPSGVECIAIAEHFSFSVGNAIKYLWRAGLKTSDPIKDLEKAAWYVAREIKRLEKLKGGA